MTAHWLITSGCLIAAAVVLGWPRRSRQTRLLAGQRSAPRSLREHVESLSSGRAMVLAVALAALTGTLLAGPVAGVVAGGYGVIGVRVVLRRRSARAAAALRTRSLDALCGLAADLRAGLATGGAPSSASSVHPLAAPAAIEDRRMAQLAEAAWRLAERTGAPIADLVERIEADARAMDRASASAAAQAAGARATAWLLAALPVGGIALGYSIGADPLAVLLHTPIGAACAVGAIALQAVGLAWADRLAAAGTTGAKAAAPAATTTPAPLWTADARPAWPRSTDARPAPRPRPRTAAVVAGRPSAGSEA
ncbi:hypothetical protein RB614_27905 [Phytohabitans sp. ZYX-F-186]|uniref:Type II secretion system protein GspF domain-containing protein n=1 Tax=Phytohabitans maris TaxID=3071409 RepID=A0ABU0ZMT9_9ACTN|nr:hypothetical protein [Phytohabitans sp. ZYX-F-186]MDQ7908358.1 hypothetical protein [Phytohabitans sp. ZYX-F-186]